MDRVITTILTDERARSKRAVEKLLLKSVTVGQWWL